MIELIVAVLLIAVAFYAGLKTSDRYHENAMAILWRFVRQPDYQNGVGYVPPPPQVARRRRLVGREFEERLQKTGHAIQKFTPSSP